MTGQREGFIGDILDKVKDLVTDDEPRDPKPKEDDPILVPQCCGPMPPGHPLVGLPVEHDANCPNHPDNLADDEKAS
ncbi:hypothetical protein G7043_02570 [Lentzea sp. NEAU-D13]|uniref:Uncharacterized protein n=1 Tax=Lentzea alba TaxID=2714351 RepID=A0A7C9RLA7_9PSEU|nr:hypothetical protein [Lentzea alba]NGY57811.1 hypothetical protein [Lentzea alba]